METNISKIQDNLVKTEEVEALIATHLLSDEVSTKEKLDFVVKLKASQKIIDDTLKLKPIKEVISEITAIETANGAQKLDTGFGYTINYGTTWTGYNFENCNHIGWDFINTIQKMFKEDLKEIEKKLKGIPQGESKKVLIDPEELISKLKLVMDTAQEVIAQLNESQGIFVVNAPIKSQTKSLILRKNKND